MDRKLKNTLVLLVILILILGGGGAYGFIYQKNKLAEKQDKVATLESEAIDTDELIVQLDILRDKAAELDSILALRKFIIPVGLSQYSFFDFVNKVSGSFSSHSFVNIVFENVTNNPNYDNYIYTLSGTATFTDLFELVYAVEHSKELKKVSSLDLGNFISVDDDEVPHYLVNFNMKVQVYYSSDNRFATTSAVENKIKPGYIYNIFFPLIRDKVPPNTDELFDVQTGHLLALIPDGAYMTDASGRTYLLWEGDRVYLGYMTKINYEDKKVQFIINKGGIIEKITLELEKETNTVK